MKLIDVKKGETVSLAGWLLEYKGTEKGTALFRDVRKGNLIIYGFDAAKITIKQYGYNLLGTEEAYD